MNLAEDIKPISFIKTHAADMLRRVNDTHNPIVITQNGEARAVLLDTDSYQEMRDSLGIMKLLSESETDIRNNKTIKHDNVFNEIQSSLNIQNDN
jgi:prevent-host-death family protein